MTHPQAELDLLSVGAWACFDHFAHLEAFPEDGKTIRATSPLTVLEQDHFGDCSINVAAVAASLGARVGLATLVGDDFVTSGYWKHLETLSVNLSAVEVREGRPSGHNYLFSDATGRAVCISHLGVASDQAAWRVPAGIAESARCLVANEMFGPATLDAMQRSHTAGRLTAINGMVATAGEHTPAFLAATRLLFIAERELDDLVDLLGMNGPESIRAFGPEAIIVTRGSAGSDVWTHAGRTTVPIIAADVVVDTTGAGDAFVAGTLTAYLNGLDIADAARMGAAAASFVVEAWGAQSRLPSWQETRRRAGIPCQESLGGRS